jgi:hypothetical protein
MIRYDRLNTKYNVHSVKATRGAKGRPSGGLLFGWRKNVDAVILDTNENFAIILVPNMNLFIFFVYVQPNGGYSKALSVLLRKLKTTVTRGGKY